MPPQLALVSTGHDSSLILAYFGSVNRQATPELIPAAVNGGGSPHTGVPRHSASMVVSSRPARGGQDALRWLLAALLITNVSRVHEAIPLLSKLHPALILAGLSMSAAVLMPRWICLPNVFASWPGKVVAGLGILACVSAPFGLSFGGSASYVLTDYSKVLIFSFLLMVAIRDVRDLRFFTWAFVAASAILVWMALFLFSISRSRGSLVSRLGGLYTYDSNDMGCILVVGLALAIALFQTSRGKWRWLYVPVLLGIGAAIARSGSRGGLLALIGAGLALLALQSHVRVSKRVGFVLVLAVGLVVTAPPGYWEQMRTMLEPKQDYNWTLVDGRRQLFNRGVGYMMSYPIFGLGIDNFSRAEGTISGKASHTKSGTGIRWTAPHNSFTQAGAELGIPGLLLWAGLVLGGAAAMVALRRRLPRAWIRGNPDQRFLYVMTTNLGVALVGFAIAAFFVSFAWIDLVYILAAFMSGVYAILKQGAYAGALPAMSRASAATAGHRVSRQSGQVPVRAWQ